MPKSWNMDKGKRKKCHIPHCERHISKTKMAGQMIDRIHDLLPIKPYWVGFDALYGTCLELLYWLEEVE